MIRRLIAGVAAATIVAVPAAAVPPAQAADPVVFTVGILSDIDSLNPFTGILAESYEMFQLQYSTLLSSSSADFTPDAGLAESWEASADGKTWTYTLRPDLVWSDGTPLTANDVVYTFERILNGRYEQRNSGNYVRNITSVTAPDDRTLLIRLATPAPYLLGLLSQPGTFPVHGPSLAAHGAEYARPGKLVSNGAFVLADWVLGSHVVLRRNPNYRNDAATKLEAVHFVHIADADNL